MIERNICDHGYQRIDMFVASRRRPFHFENSNVDLRFGKNSSACAVRISKSWKLWQTPIQNKSLRGIVNAKVKGSKTTRHQFRRGPGRDAFTSRGTGARSVEAGAQSDGVRMEASVAAVEPFPLVPAMQNKREAELRVARACKQGCDLVGARICAEAG